MFDWKSITSGITEIDPADFAKELPRYSIRVGSHIVNTLDIPVYPSVYAQVKFSVAESMKRIVVYSKRYKVTSMAGSVYTEDLNSAIDLVEKLNRVRASAESA